MKATEAQRRYLTGRASSGVACSRWAKVQGASVGVAMRSPALDLFVARRQPSAGTLEQT